MAALPRTAYFSLGSREQWHDGSGDTCQNNGTVMLCSAAFLTTNPIADSVSGKHHNQESKYPTICSARPSRSVSRRFDISDINDIAISVPDPDVPSECSCRFQATSEICRRAKMTANHTFKAFHPIVKYSSRRPGTNDSPYESKLCFRPCLIYDRNGT